MPSGLVSACKAFNDEHGHLAGDRLLVQAATAWRGLLRETDTLARTGGDEFAVVLTDYTREQAEDVVGRMTDQVPAGVPCSAGLAQWDGTESVEARIARADAALYDAKAVGPVAGPVNRFGPIGWPE